MVSYIGTIRICEIESPAAAPPPHAQRERRA
jgi:hypothetical protein